MHDVLHQRDETVHILAAGHTGALALIDFSGLDLFLPRLLAIAPERPDGVPRFRFIIRQIKRHVLVPVSAERRLFLAA